MKTLHKTSIALAIFLLLGACATTEQTSEKPLPSPVSDINIEPHKGRINPETTIARALKYNIDTIKQSSVEKFLGKTAREQAFSNLQKLRENKSTAASLKELDFAVLYAAVNSNTDENKIDALFNRVIGQNLVQGALKAHKNELYGNKKIYEIRRKIRQYQKQLSILIKKDANNLEYKKALEDAIDKLKLNEQQINQNSADFRTLVKIDTQKTEPEGRRFFETLSLPQQAKADDYQAAALALREELDDFSHPSLEKVSQTITALYPNNEERIKGFYIQDSVYLKDLAERSDAIASELLQTTLNYQKATGNKKKKLSEKLGNELSKAIYTQTELAYSLALKATADYEAQKKNIQQIRQEIQKDSKITHPDNAQKIKLLQLQLDLLDNENLADQILAEKTIAIASLQFYSGQIIITPALLQKDIASLATFFKNSFEQKIPHYNEKTNTETEEINTPQAWAHSENWLEEVLAEPRPQTKVFMSKPLNNRIDYNQKKIMQLGAYIEKNTAEKDWKAISSAYPELQKFTPQYETTMVTGIKLFRLTIHSANGGFRDICIKLRTDGRECILRD